MTVEGSESSRNGDGAGKLKLFIGAAPGVGKTFTMLREAHTLLERGVDVVVGYVDAHDRPDTEAQIGELTILPRKEIRFQGRVFEELDVEGICARHPEVVVVDELAHTNPPGSAWPKRYMDVEYLLDHGISVLSAVNVQHLEGIHEEAEEVTGVRVRELVPVSFFKRAHEVEVIDVTPETLRQRLRDGSIYPLEKVDQALSHFFRKSNLSGLREIALRAVAEDVEERLQNSYERSRIPGPVGARESIMVCVHAPMRARKLMLRGSRMAGRMKADLYMLTISHTAEDLLSARDRQRLEELRELADTYEATWVLEPRNDRKLGDVINAVANRLNVTQIVIGQPARERRWQTVLGESPVRHLLQGVKYVDLRIVGWKEYAPTPALIANNINATSDPGSERTVRRGRLTIYVGSAPGVGKTYKILQDAHDWRRRGIDVVIGLIETHGREETQAQIGDLEVIRKRQLLVGGKTYDELDVDAILRRAPERVIIDELAHSNVPGCAREKRYQDIDYLLEQGIDVVTAVNIQHLESLHDTVEHITGVKVRERVPDWFMKLAREVKLIDVTPETLQQRLMDGKIYTSDKVMRALENFFQLGNLAALREIALLEVADDVDQRINRDSPDPGEVEAAQERILVCVNYRPHSERLIRRGWRLADRLKAELWVLVVLENDKRSEQEQRDLDRIQKLSEEFDAHFITRQVGTQGVGGTIVAVADELHTSQLVIGRSLPPTGIFRRFRRTPIDYVLEHADFVDLYVMAAARD